MIAAAVPARGRRRAAGVGAAGLALVAIGVAPGDRALLDRPLPDRLDFLWQPAGFQIPESLFPAGPESPVWLILLAGLANTGLAAALAALLAIPAGIGLALGRGASIRLLRAAAGGLIETVRNTPLLLQLFLWYAVVTQALPGPRQALLVPPGLFLCNRGLFLPWPGRDGIAWPALGAFNITGGVSLTPEMTVLVGGLGLFHGCYLAEIIRAGIRAVPAGQRDAAAALGFDRLTAFRRIVLPQALGFALPPVAVQAQALVRNTALAVAIGFPDFVGTLATLVNRNGRTLEGLLLTGIVFLAVNAGLGALVEGRRRPRGNLSVEPCGAARSSTVSRREVAVALLLGALAAPGLWAALCWALRDAVWAGPPSACAAGTGACWAVVTEKSRLLLVGLYPGGAAWRPAIAAGLVVATATAAGAMILGRRSPTVATAILPATGLLAPLWLFGGGYGLARVPSGMWGGLSLTILLAACVCATATAMALPVALARRSPRAWLARPALAAMTLFRSVPLVALLLASDLLLPQLVPAGAEVPKLVRAFLAVALLATVNLAEVLRAALDSVPSGQDDAARALGLPWHAAFAHVILPQALRIALPAAVNVYVGAIKDTSLVAIVGLFDVTGAAKAAVADPGWMRHAPEIYLFLAAAYFAVCFPITRVARRLERQATAASPSRKRSISAASL